jgi:hypothetical protein
MLFVKCQSTTFLEFAHPHRLLHPAMNTVKHATCFVNPMLSGLVVPVLTTVGRAYVSLIPSYGSVLGS